MEDTESTSFFGEVLDWIVSSGLEIAIILVVIGFVRNFGDAFIKRSIRRTIKSERFESPLDEKKREDTIISIVITTFHVAIYVIGGLLIVQALGVAIGPMLAGLSVVGVALGFGAQSLVKDFVSGLFIIMENQYRVGDVIEIAGVSGVVEAITMRETILRNLDGHVHHIPNGLVEVATNMTMDFSNINLNVGVAYNSDIKKVEKVIDEVGVELSNDEEFSEDIIEAPHFVRVDNFGASEVEIKILGKVKPGKQWSIAGEFRQRLKKAFDKNKIEIPFPQVDVHSKK